MKRRDFLKLGTLLPFLRPKQVNYAAHPGVEQSRLISTTQQRDLEPSRSGVISPPQIEYIKNYSGCLPTYYTMPNTFACSGTFWIEP